jgi:hypothetical protein
MIAAIVAPAGVRSIAMMRACLVLGRVGDYTPPAQIARGIWACWPFGRLSRPHWIWAWSWDPPRFMRRHPPHHLSPAWAKHPAGPDPEASPSRPKSPQQRSDQTRKPVNSEQDSCSYAKAVDL